MGIMRRLMYRSYGGPETLFIAEVPEPEPGKGQVLIRQAATSVNGGDLQARSGQVRFRTAVPRGFPKGIGQDVVGTVAELGTGVEDLAVGDLVWGVSTGSDAAADLVVMDGDRVAHAPAGIDPVRLAALPVAGTTSLAALVRNGGISAGRRVLIRGVGSVGTTAVQGAIAYGSEVTALCSPLTIDGVKELGADHVLSYLDADPSRLGRFDLILDTVGRGWEPFREQLAPGGRMLTITVDPAHPMASLGRILASSVHGSRRIRFQGELPKRDVLDMLTRLVERGALTPVIDSIYPLADAEAAHRHAEERGILGKIILQIS